MLDDTLFTMIPDRFIIRNELDADYHDNKIRFPHWYAMYRRATKTTQREMEHDFRNLLLTNPDLAMETDDSGDLPLHHMLVEDHGTFEPNSVELLKILLNAYPDSVKVADSKGALPLHLACRYGSGQTSTKIIKHIIRMWPEALTKPVTLSKSKKHMLPLHIASEYMSMDVVRLLIECHPKTLMIPNGNGDLALHITCKRYNVGIQDVSLVYDFYPTAIRIPNNKGELPMHISCGRRSRNSLDVIKFLLDSFPESIKKSNGIGELPLHYSCNGYQPLEVVRYLVSKFDHAIEIADCNNMLPIHHACQAKFPVMDVIEFLTKASPKSLAVRGENGSLPSHIACPLDLSMDLNS